LPIEQDEQLRSICFYERIQKQDLLREVVNLLLEKRGQRQPPKQICLSWPTNVGRDPVV
jgi:hypothetical protein